jgi:hypothetical protein
MVAQSKKKNKKKASIVKPKDFPEKKDLSF